jgi:hypothetical protein
MRWHLILPSVEKKLMADSGKAGHLYREGLFDGDFNGHRTDAHREGLATAAMRARYFGFDPASRPEPWVKAGGWAMRCTWPST